MTVTLWVDSPGTENRCDGGAQCAGSDDNFIAELDNARKQLFTGRLDYTKPSTLKLTVGKPTYFDAEVSGAWRVTQQGKASAKVAVGGQVSVNLHCSGVATCKLISSKRQPVTNDQRFRETTAWVWEVTPKKSGTVYFALTVTSYYKDTATVLYEKPPITAQAKVKEAPKDEETFSWVADTYGWLKKMIEELALIATALAAILGLWLAWKQRNSHPLTGPSAPSQNTGAAQPTQPGQAQSPTTTAATAAPAAGNDPPSGTP